MLWHEFVYSNGRQQRIWRHVATGLIWLLYISFTVFYLEFANGFQTRQTGLNELGYLQYGTVILTKSFLLVLAHLFFCYAIIYILLPRFQLKNDYRFLAGGLLLASILVLSLGYFLYTFIYPFIDTQFHLHSGPDKLIVWRTVDGALINAIKITLVIVAITLVKQWWQKQKENERLEKEKVNAELQLLKAQIHPAFLFSTLGNITEHARQASPKAPEMLIKLSDLLSYMLYDCDASKVTVDKELSMLKEYISLEELRQGDKLEMTVQISGNSDGQLISPLLLLPFIDSSFSHSEKQETEKAWVNLNITIEDGTLQMKLISGIPAEIPLEIEKEHSLTNVRKRLQLLYPQRFELKINTEQELLIIYLNLKLEEALHHDQDIKTGETSLSYA